ncbi:MAG: family metallopeptidase [Glaciihabitans sp.]|jgi:murein DD-endopeptidase MepM/ murein hydrolase activator NlpD|nr:family metallopeptidase [Glaciihabitans sp.]MDQ1569338.1 hypothetical protein [Actinomycetota bacterium]
MRHSPASAVFLALALVAPLSLSPLSQPLASDAAATPLWAWPVRGAHVIVRPFIAPVTRFGAGHRGIDIAAAGDVLAPADGVVHFAGVVVDRPVISLDHGGGILSSFEPVTTTLAVGDAVTRGEVIGRIRPGHCSRSCIHLGVRIDGGYVSPLLFLGGIPHSVLLPTRRITPAGAPARRFP